MRSARWATKTYGADKSTLLHIIVGLETPDIGQVRIDVTRLSAANDPSGSCSSITPRSPT